MAPPLISVWYINVEWIYSSVYNPLQELKRTDQILLNLTARRNIYTAYWLISSYQREAIKFTSYTARILLALTQA